MKTELANYLNSQSTFERTKSEPTTQAPAVSSLPWYVSDSHFTKHNVILGNNPEFGAHICTLPEFKDGTAELADFIVAACNSNAANLARIAALENALRQVKSDPSRKGLLTETMDSVNAALLGE